MNKRTGIYFTAAAILSFTLFSGCAGERKELQTSYRSAGITALESGDYDNAVEAFDNALAQCVGKIGENEKDICFYKAAAQYAKGDMQAAADTYTALIEYEPKSSDAYYLRGCIFLQQGNADNAVLDFDNAVKYGGDDYELYIRIYENLSCYDMKEKGEEYLNKAFSIKGSSKEDYLWRGRIYYYLGQYENAAAELDAALKKENAAANVYRGQVCEAMGDAENAERYYQAYIESGAADSQTMNSLAELQMQKENYSDAIVYLKQAMEMEHSTNEKQLRQNLIICYEYTADFEMAWTLIQAYMEDYPDDETAQREYIFLKNRMQQTEVKQEESTEDTQQTES